MREKPDARPKKKKKKKSKNEKKKTKNRENKKQDWQLVVDEEVGIRAAQQLVWSEPIWSGLPCLMSRLRDEEDGGDDDDDDNGDGINPKAQVRFQAHDLKYLATPWWS